MMTARQRAEEFMKKYFGYGQHPMYRTMMEQLILSFKEHAQDQQFLCAQQIGTFHDSTIVRAVENAPAPGE